MATKSHKGKKSGGAKKAAPSHMMRNVIGVFAAGAVAATAGTLFLYGKNAKHNRKAVRGWTIKMKGEIVDKMEKLGEINQEVYHALVDEVTQAYGKLQYVDAQDLQKMAKELKSSWKDISKQLVKSTKSLGKNLKKAAKRK